MSEMIVQVRNKMLRRIGGVNHFVSHNKDYTIQFQFDESWDNVRTKMAVFAYEDGEYGSEIFDGDTCNVPELPREGRILIGVKAGEDLSTELLCIPVCKSTDDVITDEYDEPDPKIYEQILDIINNLWNGGTTVYPSPVKFLASPSAAKVGDLIRVKEVDENGDVTRTEGFDVGVELEKKIDAPQTAAVGEVLTVEEVGEDGKPKAWKTQEMNAIRFSEQDLTYDQKTQARKNIDAIDRSYNIVNGFNDILKANCNLGVCRGIQMGSAPTGMCFPIIFLYGYSNRGITDLTLYDSKGQVWKTSNSRGEWGPFTLSNNENLIVNITELSENGSSRLVSDTSAEDIYTAIQNGKHVIAVFKGDSGCSIFSCIDSNTDGDTYNNTFASLLRTDYEEYQICGTTLENTDVIDNFLELVTVDGIESFALYVDKAIKQERMHVTITATGSTGNFTYTADKTSKEILEAVSRGVVPTCTYPLTKAPYGPQEVACIFSQWVEMPGANNGYVSFTQTTDDVTYICNIYSNGSVACYQQNRDTSDKLVAPANAQVGQIVRVKSVDDSGKITATEAIPHPVLYVTISKTGNTNTSDKTFAEIKSAYDSGCSVFAVVDSFVLPLLAVSDNAACFCATTPDGELHRVSVLITESSVSLAYGSFVEGNQGVENAGKILGIGNDGNVVPEDKPVQALAGAAAPTTATVGVVGQEYYVIVDNAVTEMYVCTSALIGSYTWDKVEFGGDYTLPEATSTAIGGIKADDAQTTDTQAVRKGTDGKLYTASSAVTDAQVNTAVFSWLTEHPEATTTVTDGSVTPQKTSFLEVKYHNILNWNDTDAQDGYFFYTDDSAAITGGGSAGYCVSGYVPVEAGKTYCFVKVRKVKWLDSAKTYILTSSPSDADIKFTAPENAAFARIDTNSAEKEIAYIYEYTGEEYDYSAYATEYEIFSGDPKYSDMITRSIVSSMNDGSVNVPNLIPENTLGYKQIKGTNEFHWNIINPEKCRFGIEISATTGAEVNKGTTNLYYYTSDYTAVEPNEILMGKNYRVIGYDSNKQFVSQITWSGGKYIIPDNVKFIRAHSTGYATAQDSAKIVLLRNKYGKSFAYSDNYSYDNLFPMFSNEDCLNGYKGYLGVRRRSNDKISVIGDSFTAPSTWVNLMCEKLGAYKIANHAVSGGAFADYDGVPKTAYEQAQEMVANSEMPDVILVTLGTNDCNNNRTIGDISYTNDISTFDLTTFTGGLQACINYLANNYPTAKIYVGWTPMGGLYSTSHEPTPYITRMQTVCMAYGVQYIETRTCGVSPLVTAHAAYFENGVKGGHPTGSGQQRIGEYMARLMECTP